MARLGDVCFKITDGSHNPPQGVSASEYLMLSSKNIFDDVITLDDPRYLSKEDFELENKRTQIATGDILLTIVGTVGRAAVVPDLAHNICLQRSVAVLKPKSETVLPRYLMYQLQSMRAKLEKEAKGVAQKGIYLKQVENLPIRVLSMYEQTEIVSSLDIVSNLLSLRKQQLAKLDELVKARFVELFGDPENNNKGWPVRALGELCSVGSSKRVYQNEQSAKGVPFWRISDLVSKMDTGTVDSELFIPEEKYSELEKAGLVPTAGDILVTSRGTLGRCYIIKEEDRFYFQDGMISWLSKYTGGVTPLYLQYLFMMSGFRKQIDSMQSGSTVAYLSIAMLKKLRVMVPKKDVQETFAIFVAQTDKSKFAVQQSIEKLETLKKSLMQQYFG